MKNTRVKILKIAIDFSEFMPKMITEYALKIMTSVSETKNKLNKLFISTFIE
jgi:hypothetical protein